MPRAPSNELEVPQPDIAPHRLDGFVVRGSGNGNGNGNGHGNGHGNANGNGNGNGNANGNGAHLPDHVSPAIRRLDEMTHGRVVAFLSTLHDL